MHWKSIGLVGSHTVHEHLRYSARGRKGYLRKICQSVEAQSDFGLFDGEISLANIGVALQCCGDELLELGIGENFAPREIAKRSSVGSRKCSISIYGVAIEASVRAVSRSYLPNKVLQLVRSVAAAAIYRNDFMKISCWWGDLSRPLVHY